MLSQIKAFFKTQPIANLQQLADALQADPDAVRGMLTVWMAKGRVRCLSQKSGEDCRHGGCDQCVASCGRMTTAASRELYCWQ